MSRSLNQTIMAQVVFFSKGIVYDTDKQVVQLHQVVERFMLDASPCEKCVVTGIEFAQTVGYTYTLVGLKSKNTYTSRFIFRECDSANGFYADFECLTYMAAEQVETVVAQAAIVEERHRQEAVIANQRLHRGALVVEYSEKALAIFTEEPADVQILERIKAKRNSSLTYQGRKVAGWIFPKYRQSQLAAVMSL